MKSSFLNFIKGAYRGCVVLLALLLLSACETSKPQPSPAHMVWPATPWIEIYFSQPELELGYRGGPDSAVAEAIDQAKYTVELAVYHLDLWSIRDALIRAHRRGVIVRVVVDSDNKLDQEIRELEQAGIAVLGDRRESLMHHKFVIIDSLDIWTGSMNFTVNGAYRNNNHLIRIQSKEIALNYLQEFNEMYDRDAFGALSLPDTPFPRVEVENTLVETMFSPEDHVVFRILELIKEAEQRIEILSFTLTHDAIADALLQQSLSGIDVVGVVEASMIDQTGSDVERLREAGLDIRLMDQDGLMHHKVIVLDGKRVLLGSYNFSRSAEERNDENVLIVHHPSIAEEFRKEFLKLYQRAENP
jgi:phosphatidylserine/phosphatidylglycerophosphate/cardiolipin synthase-like enzyme